MVKLLEIKIDSEGSVSFESHYNALRGMNLYQDVFVSLLFETDQTLVRRWMSAIRILGLADVGSAKRPAHTMAMFNQMAEELAPARDKILKNFGGELNFKFATA